MNGHDRYRRVPNDLFGDTSEDHAFRPAPTVRSHDDGVDVVFLGVGQDLLARFPLSDLSDDVEPVSLCTLPDLFAGVLRLLVGIVSKAVALHDGWHDRQYVYRRTELTRDREPVFDRSSDILAPVSRYEDSFVHGMYNYQKDIKAFLAIRFNWRFLRDRAVVPGLADDLSRWPNDPERDSIAVVEQELSTAGTAYLLFESHQVA